MTSYYNPFTNASAENKGALARAFYTGDTGAMRLTLANMMEYTNRTPSGRFCRSRMIRSTYNMAILTAYRSLASSYV